MNSSLYVTLLLYFCDILYKENLHAKFGTTILYKSPRGSVLRTPATLNLYSYSPASQVVLILVVLGHICLMVVYC